MSIINVHQDLALAECKIVELRSEVEGLRAEVERLTRERDEAEGARILNANALKAALATNEAMAREDYLNKQAIRVGGVAARELNEEVGRLRAAAIPEDAEERIADAIVAWRRTDPRFTSNQTPSQADIALAEKLAGVVLAALRRDA